MSKERPVCRYCNLRRVSEELQPFVRGTPGTLCVVCAVESFPYQLEIPDAEAELLILRKYLANGGRKPLSLYSTVTFYNRKNYGWDSAKFILQRIENEALRKPPYAPLIYVFRRGGNPAYQAIYNLYAENPHAAASWKTLAAPGNLRQILYFIVGAAAAWRAWLQYPTRCMWDIEVDVGELTRITWGPRDARGASNHTGLVWSKRSALKSAQQYVHGIQSALLSVEASCNVEYL